jgi:hypothetical protein
MDTLVDSVSSTLAQSVLPGATSEAKQDFQRYFITLYGERSAFYAPLQIQSGAEAPLQGTLFWEAAKSVANAYFPDNAASATINLSVGFGLCLEGIKGLRVRLAETRDL